MSAERMRSIGLAGYLTKPVRQSRLFDAIIDATAGEVPAAQSARVVSRPSESAKRATRSGRPACCWPKTTKSIRWWPAKS